MTIEEMFSSIDGAIAKYEEACRKEEILQERVSEAQQAIMECNAQASSAEEPSEQRAALERTKAAAHRLQLYQNELQQAKAEQSQAKGYLSSARAKLEEVINVLEAKLPKIAQSIRAFEQMSTIQYGGATAAAQLPKLRETLAAYERNIREAYSYIDRIDSVLNGSGSQPRLVLKR